MSILFYFGLFAFLSLCLLLSFVILIQESKTSGLGVAFGGDPRESLFGTSTAQVLKKFTGYLACFFMIGSIILSLWTSSIGRAESRPISPKIEVETE